MTQHGSDEESRVHLRARISSGKLLERLSYYHAPVKLIQSSQPNEPITVSIPAECFEPFTSQVKARLGLAQLQITGRELLRIVAQFYELTVRDMQGPRRTSNIVRARFAFYYLASRSLQLTNAAIGRLVNRDVSVIHHGLYVIDHQETRLTKDDRLMDEIELIWLRASEQFGIYGEAAE